MKHLKIENKTAFFKRGESWLEVTEMTKDDLMNLAKAAVEEDDFISDPFDESAIPNPAQKIIYQHINSQLADLHDRRKDLQEEVRKLYNDAYNKYCLE